MSSAEEDELEERVKELESTVQKMLPNRRQVLKGGATALAAGAAGFGAGTASAEGGLNDGDTQWGSNSNRDDYLADYVDANVVDTDELSGTYVGKVRGFANGEVVASIDPGATNTPVQDAIDLVNAATADGYGRVIIPPGTVQEAASLSGLGGIQLLGYGSLLSTIEFTDLSVDGITVGGLSDGRDTFIDGVQISGSDSANRTGGSAFHFTSDVPRFNLGRVRFKDWIDAVVHFDTGHPYSSTWGDVRFQSGSYSGRAIWMESGGPAFAIQNLYVGNSDGSTEVHIAGAGGHTTIGEMNCGGSGGTAINASDTGNAALEVGPLNYETGSTVTEIVKLNNGFHARIWFVKNAVGTCDYMVSLTGAGQANNIIGTLRNNGTLNNTKINVGSDPTGESWYYGPSSDITVNHGGTTEGEVRSLASAGTGNG